MSGAAARTGEFKEKEERNIVIYKTGIAIINKNAI